MNTCTMYVRVYLCVRVMCVRNVRVCVRRTYVCISVWCVYVCICVYVGVRAWCDVCVCERL